MAAPNVNIIALSPYPLINRGDDLVAITLAALAAQKLVLRDGDILVYAQKVISKSEGRKVSLASIKPGNRAIELSKQVEKDPRLVELILRESQEVVRAVPNVLIVRHRLGYVLANAGIDASNVDECIDDQYVLLLPENPDMSALNIRSGLSRATGCRLAVVVNDSFGRAWRMGTVGTAIGSAGLATVVDMRGTVDLFGRQLQSTDIGFADEISAAASMVQGQAGEGTPVVLVRGLAWAESSDGATTLVRPRNMDLFP